MIHRTLNGINNQHNQNMSSSLKRNRSPLALVSLALTFAISACGSIPIVEDKYNVKAGKEVSTAYYTAWNGDCSTRTPSIRIVNKPTNGAVVIRPKKQKIGSGAELGKNNLCEGKTVIGSEVFYVPNSGYTGTDEFLLESTIPGQPGAARRNITVTVR